jgi:hypothetical protein
MHMPLTPEANLVATVSSLRAAAESRKMDVLDELLGLDIAHAVDTGNTVTASSS